MTVEISANLFLGIIGGSMWLFETGFRIIISAMVISELAVDLSYLISQTEVYFGLNSIHKKLFSNAYFIFQNQIEL